MSTDHALIQEIKGCLSNAQHSVANADVWKAKAGVRLTELKGRTGHGNWLKYLKQIGINDRYASRLMRAGRNIDALFKERERTKEAMKKNRERMKKGKSDSRESDLKARQAEEERARLLATNGGNPNAGQSEEEREAFLRKLGCDYNPEDPAHVAEPGDRPEDFRRRIFIYHAEDSLRHAHENGFDKAGDCEIDDEIISAARIAAEAWADLYQQLLARHTARKGGYSNGKEASTGAALH